MAKNGLVYGEALTEIRSEFERIMRTHSFEDITWGHHLYTFYHEFDEGAQVQLVELCHYDKAQADERIVTPGTYIRGGLMYRHGFLKEWEEHRQKKYFLYNCEDCHNRFALPIMEPSQIESTVDGIISVLEKRRNTSKDDDRKEWKQREKEYRAELHAMLKPHGFNKKGNHSVLQAENGLVFDFDPQKSSFCDEFYFNWDVHVSDLPTGYFMNEPIIQDKLSERYGFTLAQTRFNGNHALDWMLADRAETMRRLQVFFDAHILPLINMPVGKDALKHISSSGIWMIWPN